jgi:hypothetical protein
MKEYFHDRKVPNPPYPSVTPTYQKKEEGTIKELYSSKHLNHSRSIRPRLTQPPGNGVLS